jgi:RNA polymerase sigma factor (sigma-70 family)
MSDSDQVLFERVKKGDRHALGALLLRHGPAVRAALYGRISPQWRSVLSEDDVMQVAYLDAVLHIVGFQPNGPSVGAAFQAWLRRIAENNLRDAIRGLEAAKRPQPVNRLDKQRDSDTSFMTLLDMLAGSGGTPSQQVALGEFKSFLEQALARMPKDYATVIRLYDLESRDVADVAREMGRSEGAIFMLRARAHDRLREFLPSESKFFSYTG